MDDQKQNETHPLDIPDFLVRDPVTNTAEFMMSEQAQEIMKERAKPKSKPAEPAKAKSVKTVKTKPTKDAKQPKVKAKTAEKPKKAKAVKAESKVEKDQFGLRKGSTRSKAVAMYARKSGATLEEVKEAVGSIQLNVLKELEANGFTVEKEKETRKGKRPLTRYWLKVAK